MMASKVQVAWTRLEHQPAGRWLFSFAIARAAPYFKTVRPRFRHIRPHYAELVIRKRRSVENHLGSVHAIALCNGLEGAAAALAEMTLPAGMRWIPQGMQVEYLAKATSDVTCIAETTAASWDGGPEVAVSVRGVQPDGTEVIRGMIRLWVTAAR